MIRGGDEADAVPFGGVKSRVQRVFGHAGRAWGGNISMADFGLPVFAMFFMQSASFPLH